MDSKNGAKVPASKAKPSKTSESKKTNVVNGKETRPKIKRIKDASILQLVEETKTCLEEGGIILIPTGTGYEFAILPETDSIKNPHFVEFMKECRSSPDFLEQVCIPTAYDVYFQAETSLENKDLEALLQQHVILEMRRKLHRFSSSLLESFDKIRVRGLAYPFLENLMRALNKPLNLVRIKTGCHNTQVMKTYWRFVALIIRENTSTSPSRPAVSVIDLSKSGKTFSVIQSGSCMQSILEIFRNAAFVEDPDSVSMRPAAGEPQPTRKRKAKRPPVQFKRFQCFVCSFFSADVEDFRLHLDNEKHLKNAKDQKIACYSSQLLEDHTEADCQFISGSAKKLKEHLERHNYHDCGPTQPACVIGQRPKIHWSV